MELTEITDIFKLKASQSRRSLLPLICSNKCKYQYDDKEELASKSFLSIYIPCLALNVLYEAVLHRRIGN